MCWFCHGNCLKIPQTLMHGTHRVRKGAAAQRGTTVRDKPCLLGRCGAGGSLAAAAPPWGCGSAQGCGRSRTVEAVDGIGAWKKQFMIRQVLT